MVAGAFQKQQRGWLLKDIGDKGEEEKRIRRQGDDDSSRLPECMRLNMRGMHLRETMRDLYVYLVSLWRGHCVRSESEAMLGNLCRGVEGGNVLQHSLVLERIHAAII